MKKNENSNKIMRTAVKPNYVGVRNPYALVAAIKKDPDFWSTVTEDRIGVLENTLNEFVRKMRDSDKWKTDVDSLDTPLVYAKLFDPSYKSPIFSKKKISRKKITADLKAIKAQRKTRKFGSPWNEQCGSVLTNWAPPNDPKFAEGNVPRVDAPFQGCPPDCWLIAALISVAWAYPDSQQFQTLANTNTIQIADDHRQVTYTEPATGIIPLNTSNKPAFARSQFNETWPAIYEYHMTKKLKPEKIFPGTVNEPNIPEIGEGDPVATSSHVGIQNLEKNQIKRGAPNTGLEPAQVWNDLANNNCIGAWEKASFAKTSFATVAWTYCCGSNSLSQGCTPPPYGNQAPANLNAVYSDEILVARHAYSVLGVVGDDPVNGYIILRNPWGGELDAAAGPGYYLRAPVNRPYTLCDPLEISLYVDGAPFNDEVTPYLLPVVNAATPYNPVKDGIFGLDLDDFVRYFAGYGWV